MKLTDSLNKRTCPICHSADDTQILFEQNINESLLNNLAFSSRKMPEFMNLRLVCCPDCDLLYAPSIPVDDFLQKAYQKTGYDSRDEAEFAAMSYAKWLSRILPSLPDRSAALEVGAGNGAFLQHLLKAGFQEVIGVEPSVEAVSTASETLQKHIRVGMFNSKDFPDDHFSFIAIFQTLEHINNPAQFFSEALKLLKPGGILMMVSHNYRHWLMRLLGSKSPIIDIEHLQLFSPKSLNFALKKTGFQKIEIDSLRNVYPLHYWVKLLPVPSCIKMPLLNFLKTGSGRKIGKLNMGVKVGNIVTWAYK